MPAPRKPKEPLKLTDADKKKLGWKHSERCVVCNALDKEGKPLRDRIDDKIQRLIAINTIFVAESRKNGNISSAIINSFSYIKSKILELPFSDNPIYAILCDSRLTHINKGKYAKRESRSPIRRGRCFNQNPG